MEGSLGTSASPTGEKLGVMAVLSSPSQVYRTLKRQGTLYRLSWGFSGAALLHGLMAGMMAPEGARSLLGAFAVFNAVGMALITALTGWLALRAVGRGPTSLAVVVPCVAYGFGVTLLVSWIPGSFWFAEPWKWGVIGTGFRELGEVSGRRAFGAVLVTLVALVCLFKGILMMQGA